MRELPHRRSGGAAVPAGQVRRAPSAYIYGGRRRYGWLLRSATAAGTALLIGSAAAPALERWQQRRAAGQGRPLPPRLQGRALVGRRLHQGAALLALSVLADSALEHYRGKFHNRAMYIAPTVAAAALATSVAAGARPPRRAGRIRTLVFGVALLTGLIGIGFHVRNIRERPGRFNWMNLFYAAPLGAPAAITIAGALGLAAGRLEPEPTAIERVLPRRLRPRPTLLGLPAGRALGLFTTLGLIGNVSEAWLLHFRGAYQNPFMYVPVTVPPAAAAALAVSSVRPSRPALAAARGLLRTTAAVGVAGVGFHAYGIQRNMGGWRNWSQMVLQGPPLPAPPSFTGLSLAGLAALRLIEEEVR